VSGEALVRVAGLTVTARGRRRGDDGATIVRDVELELDRGKTLGVVGESGSGKSTVALSILGLLGPGLHAEGSVAFDGRELLHRSEPELRPIRGAEIGAVFQNPFRSLNPSLRVGVQIRETVMLDGHERRAAEQTAIELLGQVGLPDPERAAASYPHTLSGGMQQRVAIALSIARDPRLLIADEPTTALDVRVQAQILELLARLVRERDMALILISHDLGVVASVADRIAVMYSGRVVESGPAADVFRSAAHPYSHALLESAPRLRGPHGLAASLRGSATPPSVPMDGCRFAPRCTFAVPRCSTNEPPLEVVDDRGHRAACWELPWTPTAHGDAAELRKSRS
jgi:oligopeptide/dipeptide ABC transporter ATP-binding protein